MEDAAAVPIKKVPRDERILFMKAAFQQEFGNPPKFIVKVPGRVNLIGEHIDYCGFPVLPMALEQDALIAAGTIREKEINIKNVNYQKYPEYKVALKKFEEIKIEPDVDGKPFWYNYVLCGVKGALEYLDNKFEQGLQILVDGNIPPASGLSSSSALVSASCLTFLHAQKAKITKTDIASLCAVSERYIGTQGGGMDQAIAFLGEKNSAQYITFLPLQVTPVTLPDDAVFVVAHSLAEANKAANNEYNSRVVECRLAAKIIATREEIETGSKMITLSQLQECRDSSLEDMIELVHKLLPEEIYSKSEISSILNISEDALGDLYLTSNTKQLPDFKLKQRALHVYEEALRVENFRKLCSGSNRINDNIISSLGNLMFESHESLKKQYECSHDNLDLLVDLSKKFGVNARLTGAGWGGCIVAICREEEVNAFMDYLTDEFYVKHCNIDRENVPSYLFATAPNDGAVIYQL
ncbi:Uncharacterized protein OBRU01_19500 [Operophtera brumata]|uniref:Galactokinase n=1 Tax=Operophtera brumata TaxID=104452 RepID=A0A0L7KWY0_OPEBR|nr:Uncharacterized protein OBRU01_19500 [Operophtera brumata]